MEEEVSKVRSKLEMRRRRDVEEAMRVAEDNNRRRRAQKEEESSSSVQSYVADKLHADTFKKSDADRLRVFGKIIASMTAEKGRYMDKGVEWAIMECGWGLVRSISEARKEFEAESVEDNNRVIEVAVRTLRE